MLCTIPTTTALQNMTNFFFPDGVWISTLYFPEVTTYFFLKNQCSQIVRAPQCRRSLLSSYDSAVVMSLEIHAVGSMHKASHSA